MKQGPFKKFSTAAAIAGILAIFFTMGAGMLGMGSLQVQAQESDTYTLLEPLPCIPSPSTTSCATGTLIKEIEFQNYVEYLFNLFIALAAVAAVFMIVYGGFLYITSDSWFIKSDGLHKLTNAILGLLLVLSSYILVRTINPQLAQIPTTLVPKLTITVTKTSGSFFDNLAHEIDTHKVNIETHRQAIQAAQQKATALESQKSAAEETLKNLQAVGLGELDPQVTAAKAQIAYLQDQINREKAEARLEVSTSALETIVFQFSSPTTGSSGKDFDGIIKDLNTQYEAEVKKLTEVHAQPDQLKKLENERLYNEAEIKLNEQVAKVHDVRIVYHENHSLNESQFNVYLKGAQENYTKVGIDIVDEYRKKITDPVLKDKLDKLYADNRTAVLNIK